MGLLPHEENVPQPIELDLTVWLSLRSVGESDSPKQLVDYRDLYKIVSDVVGTSHHKLLEGLCEMIAATTLDVSAVETVRVAARKPHVPIDGPLDHVAVEITRTRGTE